MTRKNVGRTFRGVAGCLTVVAVWGVLVAPATTRANHKPNHNGDVGGDVAGYIFCKVQFDDGMGNKVESDGLGEYVHDVDMAEIVIGRNFYIPMDFNTHKKKASIRTLRFSGGFPALAAPHEPGDQCYPDLVNTSVTAPAAGATPPAIADLAQDAELVIHGQDHDDTPVGCQRFVTAGLTVKDDNDTTWHIFFGPYESAGGSLRAPCGDPMIVERLPDVDGKSQWRFSTTGTGYLYRDNNPPHAPTEYWGQVDLPMSGLIESLTDETAPTDCSTCDTYGDGDDAGCAQGAGGGLYHDHGSEHSFRRGDSNGDGTVSIADGVSVLTFLFGGDQEPPCQDAADTDDSGDLNVVDSIAIFNWLFAGGAAPAPPQECGEDPTEDDLGCANSPNC